MKGIILAGGTGSRYYPVTKAVSKHLLPIYDKPLIYYPLSVLMLAGIREVLIISSQLYIDSYKRLLGDGKRIGIKIEYAVQETPRGIADAFIVGEEFIDGDDVCLILGDNFLYGPNLTKILSGAMENNEGATIFGFHVKDPGAFGVVEIDGFHKVLSIEEKPKEPKSNYAIPGIYIYNNSVIEIAKNIGFSERGELEITDVNKKYLEMGKLKVQIMGRGMVWLDTGTPDGMMEASEFVRTLQKSHGFYIACIEEIAWRRGYIDRESLKKIGEELKNTDYGRYIDLVAGKEE